MAGPRGHPWSLVASVVCIVCTLYPTAATSPVSWSRRAGEATLTVQADAATGAFDYNVQVGAAGETWLRGVPPAVHCGGVWYEAGSNLRLRNVSSAAGVAGIPGVGVAGGLGQCDALSATWSLEGSEGSLEWVTSFHFCDGKGGSMLAFGQEYPSGCPDSNISSYVTNTTTKREGEQFGLSRSPQSEFPAFGATIGSDLITSPDMGYVSWSHTFSWVGAYGSFGLDAYIGGAGAGPILLLDAAAGVDPPSARSLVISPLDEFTTGILGRRSACSHQKRASTCGIRLNDTDLDGNDLYSIANVTSFEACCSACAADRQCSALSFNTGMQKCFLKTSSSGRTPRTGSIGGSMCADDYKSEVLAFGVRGDLPQINGGYSLHLALAGAGLLGPNGAVRGWGDIMVAAYNTTRLSVEDDLVSSHLGVWTDNGGYYYGGGNKPNTSLFTQLFDYHEAHNHPVQYLQLDPYWYGATWTPDSDKYPGGFEALNKAIGVPLLLYSNFWKQATPAAYDWKYDFTWSLTYWHNNFETVMTQVVPESSRVFYNEIMARYRDFMVGFEVDFMDYNLALFPSWRARTGAVESWMQGYSDAAQAVGASTQLCMATPSEMLSSLTMPGITNARASGDNFPAMAHLHGSPNPYMYQDRFKIAYTSMLFWPLKVRPFLDVIWTTAVQPGNPYNCSRHNIELQAIVATISAGPVGIGDGIGYTNATLLSYIADTRGRLTHPSAPATPIDASYMSDSRRPSGEVFQTYSSVPAGATDLVFYTVLGVSLQPAFNLQVSALWPRPSQSVVFAASVLGRPCTSGARASTCIASVSTKQALTMATRSTQGLDMFHELYTLAPFDQNSGAAFLGETTKFVRASPTRVMGLTFAKGQLTAKMEGPPGEATTVQAVLPSEVDPVGTIAEQKVVFASNGQAFAKFNW